MEQRKLDAVAYIVYDDEKEQALQKQMFAETCQTRGYRTYEHPEFVFFKEKRGERTQLTQMLNLLTDNTVIVIIDLNDILDLDEPACGEYRSMDILETAVQEKRNCSIYYVLQDCHCTNYAGYHEAHMYGIMRSAEQSVAKRREDYRRNISRNTLLVVNEN